MLWIRNHWCSFWLQSQKYAHYDKSLSFSPPWAFFVITFLESSSGFSSTREIMTHYRESWNGPLRWLRIWSIARKKAMRLLNLKRRPRKELINPYKYLNRACKTNRVRLFSMVPSGRTRGKGQKLEHGKFPLKIRKEIFTESSSEKSEIIRTISHLCWKQWRNSSCHNQVTSFTLSCLKVFQFQC